MEFTCFSECLRGSCLRCSFARTSFKWSRPRGNARPFRTQIVTVPNRTISSDHKNIFKDSRSDLGLCHGCTIRCLYGSNIRKKTYAGPYTCSIQQLQVSTTAISKAMLIVAHQKVQDEAQRRSSIPWAT